MTTTLVRFWDRRRGEVEKEVNLTIPDIRKFEKTAIYPWLVMSANPHLPAHQISTFLGTGNAERPTAWLQKRRWMVGGPRVPKGQTDVDGQQAKAVRLMAENPDMSLRNLVRLLKDNRIDRSKDWCRRHRCDGASDDI